MKPIWRSAEKFMLGNSLRRKSYVTPFSASTLLSALPIGVTFCFQRMSDAVYDPLVHVFPDTYSLYVPGFVVYPMPTFPSTINPFVGAPVPTYPLPIAAFPFNSSV